MSTSSPLKLIHIVHPNSNALGELVCQRLWLRALKDGAEKGGTTVSWGLFFDLQLETRSPAKYRMDRKLRGQFFGHGEERFGPSFGLGHGVVVFVQGKDKVWDSFVGGRHYKDWPQQDRKPVSGLSEVASCAFVGRAMMLLLSMITSAEEQTATRPGEVCDSLGFCPPSRAFNGLCAYHSAPS